MPSFPAGGSTSSGDGEAAMHQLFFRRIKASWRKHLRLHEPANEGSVGIPWPDILSQTPRAAVPDTIAVANTETAVDQGITIDSSRRSFTSFAVEEDTENAGGISLLPLVSGHALAADDQSVNVAAVAGSSGMDRCPRTTRSSASITEIVDDATVGPGVEQTLSDEVLTHGDDSNRAANPTHRLGVEHPSG